MALNKFISLYIVQIDVRSGKTREEGSPLL